MAEITFSVQVPAADLKEQPITFLGKVANLGKVQYSDVSPYLASKVSAEVSVPTFSVPGGACDYRSTDGNVFSIGMGRCNRNFVEGWRFLQFVAGLCQRGCTSNHLLPTQHALSGPRTHKAGAE